MDRNANRPATAIIQNSPTIDGRAISDIVSGRLVALRVADFYPKNLCDQFSERIAHYQHVGHYPLQPDVKKIGKAIYDAAADPPALEDYYATAHDALVQMRNFFHPYLSPMDKIRLVLQEVWPAGSMIESLHGKLMFCGLVRMYLTGSEARPHQDMTHWDIPDSPAAKTLVTQIAANIYLAPGDDGGNLELWSYGITDRDEYDRARTPSDYGLDRKKLLMSVAEIKPLKGELILFDARKIHAVSRINVGVRITVSCFIGYRSPAAPLTVYS